MKKVVSMAAKRVVSMADERVVMRVVLMAGMTAETLVVSMDKKKAALWVETTVVLTDVQWVA